MQQAFYSFYLFLKRLFNLFPHEKHLHNARWADPDELKRLQTTKLDGLHLFIGKTAYNQLLRVPLTSKHLELGNALIVARTRGGKGLLANAQLLTWPGSAIVNDIKGELFQQTAGYRKRLGDVYVIDPDGVGHQYDPLYEKQTERELLSSAKNLLYQPHEGEGAIFTKRASTMLTQMFLAAKMENQRVRETKHRLLPYVLQTYRLGFIDAIRRLHAADPYLATQFLDAKLEHADLKDKFLHSAWSTLTTDMRELLTEETVRCFAGSDFTARKIMMSDKPVTVYLRWPERDLLALSPLIKLVWTSLIDELIHTYDTAKDKTKCHPVLLLIDEAGRTGIPKLDEYSTTVVGRGISLWIAIQSLSQLEAIYGRARAEVLRDNCDTQIYYRPANQKTAEYLEDCLGLKSDWASSRTMHEGTETSQGSSEHGVPLMPAHLIKQLPDEEIIAFHRNLPPFRATRIDWRDFPILAHRRSIVPPELPVLPQMDGLRPTNWGNTAGEITPQFVNPDLIQ